jgi:hypothetical protein
MPSKARSKGIRGELHVLNMFKEYHPNAKTSREASKYHDDSKIDLVGIPVLVQIKTGYNSINATKVLNSMDEALLERFEKNRVEHRLPKILIQKKDNTSLPGKKRNPNDTIVYMSLETFFNHFYKPYVDKLHSPK